MASNSSDSSKPLAQQAMALSVSDTITHAVASDGSPPARNYPPPVPMPVLPGVSSEVYAHVGRYAGSAVLAVFEATGGTGRMAQWVEESEDNRTEFYTRIFPKVIAKPQQVEVNATLRIEDLVKEFEGQ